VIFPVAVHEQYDACSEDRSSYNQTYDGVRSRPLVGNREDKSADMKEACSLDNAVINEGLSSHDKEIIMESVKHCQQDQTALLLSLQSCLPVNRHLASSREEPAAPIKQHGTSHEVQALLNSDENKAGPIAQPPVNQQLAISMELQEPRDLKNPQGKSQEEGPALIAVQKGTLQEGSSSHIILTHEIPKVVTQPTISQDFTAHQSKQW
jgi:hypothetical protein